MARHTLLYGGTMSHIVYIFCLRSKLWEVIVHTPSFLSNSTTSSSSLWICPGLQHTDWEWQVIVPRLEVRMRAITQLSLGGRDPSPVRGVTWPSEGDDVMYEAGSRHKVRLATPSLRAGADRVYAQTRRQALGMRARLTWVISGTDGKVTILRKRLDRWTGSMRLPH